MSIFKGSHKNKFIFKCMDLGHIYLIQGCKTTGIASYFEDFGVVDRTKLA